MAHFFARRLWRFVPRRLSRDHAVVGLAAGGLVVALTVGPVSGPVAVVFPPWWDALRTLNAAAQGGLVLRLGFRDFVVFVAPDDARGRERLWRAGAWLLLDPRGLTGCGSEAEVK